PGAYADGYFRGRVSSNALVRFVGSWSRASRLAVIRGATAISKQLRAAVANDQAAAMEKAAHIGETPEELSQLSPLWELSEKKTFLTVYGQVGFRKVPECDKVGCPDGVDPGAWGWSQVANLGEVWINNSATYNGSSAELNTVHELGHGLDQLTGGVANANLSSAHIGYIDATGRIISVAGGGWPGGYERRTAGFSTRGMPWQQHTEATSSEEFADMFLGWTYNHFAGDQAGTARYRWMSAHMSDWVALAVSRR
ncbi:MAG: hypothetical protein JXR84_07985, partial [Anaerolineae bacterium]|nr:hypothetical protein [Anaerolineae bacterium]